MSKTYKLVEVQKILQKNGWYLDHRNGGHLIYKKEGREKHIVIGRNHCNKMIIRRLFKEQNIQM